MANPLNRTLAALIAGKATAATLITATTYPESEGEIAWATDQDALYIGTDPATGGSFRRVGSTVPVTVQTAAYTITQNDCVIICNSATAYTQTLPAASGSGRILIIKNINTGAVTVDPASSDTIDGALTQILYQWDAIQVIDYAANKWIIV